MHMELEDKKRIEELERRFPDVDWYGIFIDGGIDAVEEYAGYLEDR